MTTRLLLIRHGAPHDDGRGRCYGSLDIGLSDVGRRQSEALAARPVSYTHLTLPTKA